MYKYIWLVPLLPLAGAAINGLFGRKFRFSEGLIGGIAVGSVALAFFISIAAVYSYGFGSNAQWPNPYVTSQDGFSFSWIPAGAVSVNHGASYSLLNIEWSYQLDPLSSIFMLIVTGVGLCIFIFATGYMHGEKGFYRFFAYMGLFMFAMLVLVMGSNFLMMFVGWEGVGLCSYLLIGFWYTDPEKAKAEPLAKGEAYLKDSKFQEATLEFRNALQIDDKLAAAHWGLARAFEGLEMPADKPDVPDAVEAPAAPLLRHPHEARQELRGEEGDEPRVPVQVPAPQPPRLVHQAV